MASHDNSTTRILLVDNEPDNTSVLSMGLEDEGYKVDAFNDPILALSNFRPNYYSLGLRYLANINSSGLSISFF